MRQALGHILDDFVSAVLFVVAYGASGSLRGAVGVATLAALTPAAWSVLHRRRVEPWQWSSLGLSLALGAAAWFLGSPRFIMAKPSAVHLALAAAMCRGDWLSPQLNATARQSVRTKRSRCSPRRISTGSLRRRLSGSAAKPQLSLAPAGHLFVAALGRCCPSVGAVPLV